MNFVRTFWLVMVSVCLVGVPIDARAADGVGWHNGGTGYVDGTSLPVIGGGAVLRWKVKTEAWGNASPVAFGDMVCITEEPIQLSCFDADSGAKRWSASNDYLDTLSGEALQQGKAIQQQLESSMARHRELQLETSRLQRELRRSSASSDVQKQYQDTMSEVASLLQFQADNKRFTLPNDKGIIGYGTATPVVVGNSIFALFGNGVLSKFRLDGTRIWSVWLGAPMEPMLGYHTGHASSPLIVDGVLLAGFGVLRGIDANSGKVLWESVEWRHYGTPAIANVDGQNIVITPGGDLIDVRTGQSVGNSILGVEFVGPVVVGDIVYVIGWVRDEFDVTTTQGAAYQLSRDEGNRISTKQLWRRKLSNERTYATPLVAQGKIYVIYWKDDGLEILDSRTGESLTSKFPVPGARNGSPGAAQAGDRIVMAFETGRVLTIDNNNPPTLIADKELEGARATPLLVRNRVYHRGFDHLYCFE